MVPGEPGHRASHGPHGSCLCTEPPSKRLTLPSHGSGMMIPPCFADFHFLDYHQVEQFSFILQALLSTQEMPSPVLGARREGVSSRDKESRLPELTVYSRERRGLFSLPVVTSFLAALSIMQRNHAGSGAAGMGWGAPWRGGVTGEASLRKTE